MNHQTLHVGNVGQQREYLQGIDKLPGLFLSALDFEGEDRTTAIGEVLLIELMVGMTFESRMMNSCNLRMVLQEIDYLQCVFYMALYTQTQRLYTLQEDEGIEGRDGCTSIAQDDGTDTSNVSGCTNGISKHDAPSELP